jgi:excisionase family DNA binding protein
MLHDNNHTLGLDALVANPELVASLDAEARSAVVMKCATVLAAISAAPGKDVLPNEKAGSDPILTVAEAAARLKFAKGYVYELIRSKAIPAMRSGRHFRIRAAEIEKFMREHDTVRGIENRISGTRRS